MDKLGRKNGILIHHIVGISGAALVLVAAFVHTPVCLMIARFLFGIQGGMSCSVIPAYLSEISPPSLRGKIGVVHQACLTIGIVVAQVLGLRQLLGNLTLWPYLLASPIVPALIGTILLLLILPETPQALIERNKAGRGGSQEAARKCNHNLRFHLTSCIFFPKR